MGVLRSPPGPSLTLGGMEVAIRMNARQFRAMADRCHELLRVAVRDDLREQLRQWATDFEAEAETLDKTVDRSGIGKARALQD